MDAANEIKRLLTMRQVAEFYGFQGGTVRVYSLPVPPGRPPGKPEDL